MRLQTVPSQLIPRRAHIRCNQMAGLFVGRWLDFAWARQSALEAALERERKCRAFSKGKRLSGSLPRQPTWLTILVSPNVRE